MQINKLLTKINFNKLANRKIKYIVIHYTANKGDTAVNNCKYFEKVNRNSSAHYFVDDNSIWQCVEDSDVAWHCGVDYSNGKAPYWNKCTNNNSIGIEMCSDYIANRYYISDATQQLTIELVKELMQKYNIPADNVIRHFDVTFKECPQPFVQQDYNQWVLFKQKIASNDIFDAIDKCKVIGIDTAYWKNNYNTDDGKKYFKDFIIKVAKYIDNKAK